MIDVRFKFESVNPAVIVLTGMDRDVDVDFTDCIISMQWYNKLLYLAC